MRLTGEIGTASDPDSLAGMLEAEKQKVSRLENQARILNDTITGLRSQLADARTDVADAERETEQTEREADQRVAEAEQQAEQQANVIVRVPLLIDVLDELSGGVATGAGVEHLPGESRTFKRPLNLPAKGSAPSVPGSWHSASYSGPRGNVGTDTVYLYSNIQAPGSRAFWKVHGQSVADADIKGPPNSEKVTVSGFGMPMRTLLTEADGTTQKDSTGKVTRNGTYNGYSGTFTCDNGCNIKTDDATEVLAFTGTWTFTTSLTTKRSSRQTEEDTEFLYFGIWAFEPTNPSDTMNEHEFKWAAGGDKTGITNTTFNALTGTAEFAGGAIGKYALAKVGGRAARIGTFTATATFNATFAANNSKISGRITDFKEGGSSLGSDWHVFLGSTASAAADFTEMGATGMTHGAIDGDNATGTWGATLHGSDNKELADREKYAASEYPIADVTGVAGRFEAVAGSSAAIAGAFGAACETGTCTK